MNAEELQAYIDEGIVPAKAMGFHVAECSVSKVVLEAPMTLNKNDKNTAFAGSSASLATLSCWSLAEVIVRAWALETSSPVPSVVAKETSIRYRRPMTEDFRATCIAPAPELVKEYTDRLAATGKGYIELESQVCTITDPSQPCVIFKGTFVALKKKDN